MTGAKPGRRGGAGLPEVVWQDWPMVRFSHVGQCVRDLERTRTFYVEVLGFEEVADLDVSGSSSATLLRLPDPVGLRAVYLKRDGLVLELLGFSEPEPTEPRERPMIEPGLTHISVGVDDLDETCAAVVAHGGQVFTESRLPTAVFVADPEGQVVELLAGDRFAQMLHGPSPERDADEVPDP
ncbi:MAG TPA: VOC family protein [Acidimicrobiia bacterium]|nr:VOC family protein [Acidimicrobiia bacterium]